MYDNRNSAVIVFSSCTVRMVYGCAPLLSFGFNLKSNMTPENIETTSINEMLIISVHMFGEPM